MREHGAELGLEYGSGTHMLLTKQRLMGLQRHDLLALSTDDFALDIPTIHDRSELPEGYEDASDW